MDEKIQTECQHILEVNSVCKQYSGKYVLKDISFKIQKGEILGIIGPSGAGKSTLLKCIGCLEEINSGSINYMGFGPRYQNIDMKNDRRIIRELRKRMGFVFQEYNLWEWKTVIENITLGPRVVLNTDKDVIKDKAYDLCEQFGLIDKIHSKAWELSGGQRQRVAIIRALMMEPEIILLDEITSSLDPILTYSVMQAIKKLQERGLTMILVTHHIEFASGICNRIIYLSDGKIMQIGTPEEIRKHPTNTQISEFIKILVRAR